MNFEINNPHRLKAYNQFLQSSFMKPLWNGGPYTNQRISWKLADKAKKEVKSFHSPGLYIYGVMIKLLYI